MTTEELIDYDEKLTDYFDMLVDKLNAGKIDIDKFDRLANKIEEWSEEARRKA